MNKTKGDQYIVEDRLGNQVTISSEEFDNIRILSMNEDRVEFLLDGVKHTIHIQGSSKNEKSYHIIVDDQYMELKVQDRLDRQIDSMGLNDIAEELAGEIHSPMPGLVLDVKVNVGDSVKKGDPVVTLEAMKMENLLMAPMDGVIDSIHSTSGESVNKNDLLVVIK